MVEKLRHLPINRIESLVILKARKAGECEVGKRLGQETDPWGTPYTQPLQLVKKLGHLPIKSIESFDIILEAREAGSCEVGK